MIKAIIFDFWQTLFNIEGDIPQLEKLRKILEVEYEGFLPKLEKCFMIKCFETEKEGFIEICKAFDKEPTEEFVGKLANAWRDNLKYIKHYEETLEVLNELKKKYKLALLSNTDNLSMIPIIKKFDLEKYFDVIKLSCNTGMLKPDNKLLEIICQELGVEKECVIMVGNSVPRDMKGAEDFGIKCVLIDRNNNKKFSPKIKSLRDLEKVLSTI